MWGTVCEIQTKERDSAHAWGFVQIHLIAVLSNEPFACCISADCPRNSTDCITGKIFTILRSSVYSNLDVLAYFGYKYCNHYLSNDQWKKYLVIWAMMMSALIAHTNQVHNQMCTEGGGEFVDVFEATSLFSAELILAQTSAQSPWNKGLWAIPCKQEPGPG